MRQSTLVVGQRVTLSDIGRKSLESPLIMGRVVEAKAKYPHSVSVIMDGATISRHYHRSYWK